MNSVASLPELWAGMKVNVRKVLVNGLDELFNISRFQKIKQIDFSGVYLTSEQLEKLMDDIPELPLEDINLNGRNLSSVPADKLARTVSSHLHKVNLGSTRLSTAQSTQVLDTIPSSTTLAYVNLASVNLSEVPADVLATAVCHLKTVNLSRTELTTNQWVKVLDTVPSSVTLTNLDLQRINLSEVPDELLATAVCHLKTVNLSSTVLTTNQWVKVLDMIPSSTTLTNLDLGGINLSGVPAHLLATAVCHLKNVDLSRTKLTTDQSTRLTNLNLKGINLSGVPAHIRAKTVGYPGSFSGEKCQGTLGYGAAEWVG